ncbi:hypothetical protein IMZ48_20590 [Candidatus Bathyarchaeota archaeon]|nr:hypothetical protein [Candidatus Bathyarchaeota archaeon]
MPKQRGRLPSFFGGSPSNMAKKDDDKKLPPPVTSWAPARSGPRRSARRIALLLLFFTIVYLTYTRLRAAPTLRGQLRDHLPSRESFPSFPKYENPSGAHFDRVWPPSEPKPEKIGGEPTPAGSSGSRDAQTSLSLPALPSTLEDVEDTLGNVLFASLSLKSAAALLPLACEMGRRGRNRVHYAVMSRDYMPIRELTKINGIDESCGIVFHGMHCFAPVTWPRRPSNVCTRCSPGLRLGVDRCKGTRGDRAGTMYVLLLFRCAFNRV